MRPIQAPIRSESAGRVERRADDEDARHDDSGLAAESGEGLLGRERVGDVEREHDQAGRRGRNADALGDEEREGHDDELRRR